MKVINRSKDFTFNIERNIHDSQIYTNLKTFPTELREWIKSTSVNDNYSQKLPKNLIKFICSSFRDTKLGRFNQLFRNTACFIWECNVHPILDNLSKLRPLRRHAQPIRIDRWLSRCCFVKHDRATFEWLTTYIFPIAASANKISPSSLGNCHTCQNLDFPCWRTRISV